jgi:uncharacterized membrane protein
MARESNPRLKLGDFGTFVIFTAIYAAGTLGLPQISLMAYQVKIGEIPSAFVAIFGLPAVFGLTLGQFIANLGVEAKPVTMISPVISFIGLLVIYYARKYSTLGGCIAYVIITGLWLSFMLPMVKPEPTGSLVTLSAFAGQFIAVILGYAAYLLASRTISHRPSSPTK